MARSFDAIVIGAGIAGLAVASELASSRRVLVVEGKSGYATQSSARSASSWIAGYGGPAVTPLTLASRDSFESGGAGHAERSLLKRRGVLLVSSDDRSPGLHAAETGGATPISPDQARHHFPALRDDLITAATYDDDAQDIATPIAVEALRAALGARVAEVIVGISIRSLTRRGTTWIVTSDHGDFRAGTVVDAAGAWADEVAGLAGVPPLGLTAYRRTACSFAAPTGTDTSNWPLLMDADKGYYIKPGADSFMASPADETVQAPGDAEPLPEDVNLALHHVEQMTTLDPRPIRSSWAGLRTFAPDRAPVLGPHPGVPGFAWYAGLGGWGIMTAPAAARSVVSLIDSGVLPADVRAHGLTPADVRPERLVDG